MSQKLPFQYSVLRYVHDAATGEFLNVGLAVYSKPARYFKVQIQTQYRRVTAAFPTADGEFYRQYAARLQSSFDKVTAEFTNGQLGLWDELPATLEELLSRVLPVDDSLFQFSEVQGGLAIDLAQTFSSLYARMVTRYAEQPTSESRSDEDVWAIFKRPLQTRQVLSRLQQHQIDTPFENFHFPHALRNGKWHLLEPVSFDLAYASNIRTKARSLYAKAELLSEASKASGSEYALHVLLGKPHRADDSVQKAYRDAHRLLTERAKAYGVQVVDEEAAETFASSMRVLADAHIGNE